MVRQGLGLTLFGDPVVAHVKRYDMSPGLKL